MPCPYHRQVDGNAQVSGLNGYCDAEEVWGLWIPTTVEETRYCNTEDYLNCPVLNSEYE